MKKACLKRKEEDCRAVADPAVRELLDHIAQELADEYVRLTKDRDWEEPSRNQVEEDRK